MPNCQSYMALKPSFDAMEVGVTDWAGWAWLLDTVHSRLDQKARPQGCCMVGCIVADPPCLIRIPPNHPQTCLAFEARDMACIEAQKGLPDVVGVFWLVPGSSGSL